MSDDNKLIAKNTTIIYFKLIITSLIGLISSRFIFKSLGAEDYGLYSIVGSIVVMMAFINTVMISTTYRYIAFEMGREDKGSVNKVFNISFVIHIALAIIVLILTETIGIYYVNNYLNIDVSRISDAVFVLRFSTYATVFSILSIPFQGLITALEKFSIRAIIDILNSIFILGISFILLDYLGNRIRLYAILMMITTFIFSSVFVIYGFKNAYEMVKWRFQKDKSKYKEMIGFSGWIMIGAAASVGQKSISAIIINSFFGTLLNAAYGIANTVNGIISQFSSSISQAAIPQITKNYSSGNNDRSIDLAAYVSKYTMFLLILFSTPILLETDYLIGVWLGDVPPYTIIMTKLIIINTLINGLGAGLPALVQASGKIKWFQIILSGTSLISLPISYILFKLSLPPYYIIVTFIVTATINVILWQILLARIISFDVKYFIKTSYLKVFYTLLPILPLFIVVDQFEQNLHRFIFMSLISVTTTLLSIYLLGLGKIEKEKINSIFKRLIIKIWRN